jgi:hypothetical protein
MNLIQHDYSLDQPLSALVQEGLEVLQDCTDSDFALLSNLHRELLQHGDKAIQKVGKVSWALRNELEDDLNNLCSGTGYAPQIDYDMAIDCDDIGLFFRVYLRNAAHPVSCVLGGPAPGSLKIPIAKLTNPEFHMENMASAFEPIPGVATQIPTKDLVPILNQMYMESVWPILGPYWALSEYLERAPESGQGTFKSAIHALFPKENKNTKSSLSKDALDVDWLHRLHAAVTEFEAKLV